MSVHLQIALATQMQIHDRMSGEERQHVVEKGDAGSDRRLPASVNVQLDEDDGLVGHALHLSVPLFHGCPLNRPFGGKQTENTRTRMNRCTRAVCSSPFTDSISPDNAPRRWPPRSPSPPPSLPGGKLGLNNRPPQIPRTRWFPCRVWERCNPPHPFR